MVIVITMAYMVEQKVKGHIYLYSVDSYWDKEKKQARQRRTYIGKKDPQTGAVLPDDGIRDAREFGNIFLLQSIAKQLGLSEDLAAVFPDTWREILAIAFYRICENKALYLCNNWLDTAWSEEPVSLPSPRISELLAQLGNTKVFTERFFRRWSRRYAASNRFIVFDLTSISSYANGIDMIEWGYNRDRESLPQVNLGVIHGEPSGLPLFYALYPGSIHDVTTLKNIVSELEILSLDRTIFVLDKGFYSKANLRHMQGMKFIIPLPVRCSVERDLVFAAQGKIRSSEYAIRHREHVYYCIRKTIEIADGMFTAHIYLDEHRQADNREAFLRTLIDAEVLAAAQGFTNKQQIEEYLADQAPDLVPYFATRRSGPRSALVRTTEAIDATLGRMGVFVLITNTELSSESILDYYREKDGVEKYFDSLKNNLFLKRLRIHSHHTMEGLLFVEFIAMILRSEMNVVLKKAKPSDSLCIPEMLSELRKLKQIMFGKKKALSEVSRKQKDIFAAFGIKLDAQT
ncbi:MAG: IS1634 family transposase [Rectinemataceae bacterium]|nr:IS1634 family transposase [Rectinemataceae bacterium]